MGFSRTKWAVKTRQIKRNMREKGLFFTKKQKKISIKESKAILCKIGGVSKFSAHIASQCVSG
jgi:hypothetical protein